MSLNIFNNLTKIIDDLLAKQERVTVGVSGFGGSGKTFLADRLRDHYQIKDGQVVRLDNLFAALPYGDGILDNYDWPKITQLLQSAATSSRLQYRGRGVDGKLFDFEFDEPMPKVLIVEGVRLFRPEIMPYFDASVWIDCSLEIATERGKARDRANGASAEHLQRWDTEWTPRNAEYAEKYQPEKLASFLYQES